jgi:hypothetical protein
MLKSFFARRAQQAASIGFILLYTDTSAFFALRETSERLKILLSPNFSSRFVKGTQPSRISDPGPTISFVYFGHLVLFLIPSIP